MTRDELIETNNRMVDELNSARADLERMQRAWEDTANALDVMRQWLATTVLLCGLGPVTDYDQSMRNLQQLVMDGINARRELTRIRLELCRQVDGDADSVAFRALFGGG